MKHILLLLPEQSVTGIGIGQWNNQLVAYSGCCRKTIVWDRDGGHSCPGCATKTKVQPAINPVIRLGEEVGGTKEISLIFIESWTGLEDVEVNIEWTEE